MLSGLARLDSVKSGSPLSLPTVPGVPQVGGAPESAPAGGPGTRLRISLGDVRQALSGHAVAGKATAIKIAVTQGASRGKQGYGGSGTDGVALDLDVGVLEVAAVAPEPGGGQVSGAPTSGGNGGGGLPITGPNAGALALGGAALLLGGIAALTVGLRKRRVRP
jgi:hypothetical protein